MKSGLVKLFFIFKKTGKTDSLKHCWFKVGGPLQAFGALQVAKVRAYEGVTFDFFDMFVLQVKDEKSNNNF